MSCRLPTCGSLVIENRRRDIANKLRAATLIPLVTLLVPGPGALWVHPVRDS
jgi:hypothetical protein